MNTGIFTTSGFVVTSSFIGLWVGLALALSVVEPSFPTDFTIWHVAWGWIALSVAMNWVGVIIGAILLNHGVSLKISLISALGTALLAGFFILMGSEAPYTYWKDRAKRRETARRNRFKADCGWLIQQYAQAHQQTQASITRLGEQQVRGIAERYISAAQAYAEQLKRTGGRS